MYIYIYIHAYIILYYIILYYIILYYIILYYIILYYIVCVLKSSSGGEGNIYLDSNSQDHFFSKMTLKQLAHPRENFPTNTLGTPSGSFVYQSHVKEGSQDGNRVPGIQLENLQNGLYKSLGSLPNKCSHLPLSKINALNHLHSKSALTLRQPVSLLQDPSFASFGDGQQPIYYNGKYAQNRTICRA